MTTAEPISAWIEAESVAPSGDLDPAFVHVDPELAGALASAHTRSFSTAAIKTKLGPEQLGADISNTEVDEVAALDERGLVRVGTRVGPGSILIGKISPQAGGPRSAEEKLLRAIFDDKASGWLSAAVFDGGGLDRVAKALIDGETESVDDPLLRAALGRGPDAAPAQPGAPSRSTPIDDGDDGEFDF